MDRDNTIARLENIAKHAVHTAGEDIFILNLDDGIAIHEAIEALKAQLFHESTTSDLISRQAAIEKVRAMQTYKLFMGDDMILVDKAEVQTELMMLPPAQPEPQEGYWIGKYPTTHICSECGWLIPDSKVKVFAYCPNCGARMKGERQK